MYDQKLTVSRIRKTAGIILRNDCVAINITNCYNNFDIRLYDGHCDICFFTHSNKESGAGVNHSSFQNCATIEYFLLK